MDKTVLYTFFVCNIIHCHGVSFEEQLDHIIRTQRESLGLYHGIPLQTRRAVDINGIMGPPSRPSYLPQAEAILPGHTLIKPALGMLKSSIKFPHKDLDNGAGVYGNYGNLGITYNSKSSRVLYSGFRRALSDYLMIAPVNRGTRNPKVVLTSVVLDLDKRKEANNKILRLFESLNRRNGKKRRKKKTKLLKKPIELSVLFPSDSSSSESTPKPKIALRQRIKNAKSRSVLVERPKQVRPKNALRMNPEAEEHDDLEPEPIYPETDVSESKEGYFFPDEPPVAVSAERPAKTKMELLLQTKNWFNHIKISPEAPAHEELIPKYNVTDSYLGEDVRNWWFYHQHDFQSLEAAQDEG